MACCFEQGQCCDCSGRDDCGQQFFAAQQEKLPSGAVGEATAQQHTDEANSIVQMSTAIDADTLQKTQAREAAGRLSALILAVDTST
ncbi:hypothetical protein LBMAG46_29570 [Planctomycetia bacterium]|nr:hypothetical protein LBMAG46_29570 [Planctomycetia bacterium]